MNTSEMSIMLNSKFGKEAASKVSGLEEKVKASMREVLKQNWLETSEDALFKAGVGGALLDVGTESEDGKELIRSIKALTTFNAALQAAQAGVTVNFASTFSGSENCLPLIKWWREVKEAKP